MHNIKQKNSEDYKDIRIIWFILVYFLFQAINLYIKTMEMPVASWEQFSKGILSGFLIIALFFIFQKKMLFALFVVEFIISVLFLFSLSFSSNDLAEDFSAILFNELLVYVPLGVCLYAISNYDLLLKYLYFISWPIGFILCHLAFSIEIDEHNYYMTLGYSLLFPILIVYDHFKQTKKILDLLFVIVTSLVILVAGSRGPMLCLLFFILMQAFFNKKKAWWYRIIFLLCAAIVYINITWLVDDALDILSKFDIGSRNLQYIQESNYDDTGRSALLKYFINQIDQRPFLGWGVASGWYIGQYYPHNILIDFIVSFGIPLGCLCSVALFYLVFVGIKAKDESKRRLFIILCSLSFSLLYTGTFIKNQTFFMFLAIGIKIIYDLHNQTDIEVGNNDEEV